MTLQVGNKTIETSEAVEQLPKEFVDFAIAHRSTNGDYFWNQRDLYNVPYRLENIKIVNRMWNWQNDTRALSIKFTFSKPIRHRVYGNHLTDAEKDAFCYAHDLVAYDEYFVNLAEGPDICETLIRFNLDESFPIKLNDLIQYWE